MTIYVVMQHTHGGASVPVSAWMTMTAAMIDMIDRERRDIEDKLVRWSFTAVPVNLDSDKWRPGT